MKDNNRLKQERKLTAALEPLRALEDMVDALDAKVDYLNGRIGKAEARIEQIVAEQD
jgi:peptidoglycan hydrolase CwlO-like protein